MALHPNDLIGRYISYGEKGSCGFARVDRVTEHNGRMWAITDCLAIMSNGRVHRYKSTRMVPLCEVDKPLPENMKSYATLDEIDNELFMEALRGTGEMDTGISLAVACMRDRIKEDIACKFHERETKAWNRLPIVWEDEDDASATS